MRMTNMYKEDSETKKVLEGLQANLKLEEEADVVLQGGCEDIVKGYTATKKPDDLEIEVVDDPYAFANAHSDLKVLVKHGDGSFERYNHVVE